jgi:hypothetical protein
VTARRPRLLTALNALLAIILVVTWGSVLLVKGIAGATAWGLAILVLGPLGALLVLVSMVVLIVAAIRRKFDVQGVILLALSCLLALPVMTLLGTVPVAYPATVNDVHPSLTVPSPFKRDVIVGQGGDSVRTNRSHVIWASERWAYDLMAKPYDTGSHRLEDHGIYGMDVYSPVDGTVVAVHDGEPDITPNTDEFTSQEGNYVHIRVKAGDTDAYLVMAHLKKGSLTVAVGDSVALGDHVAQVGNSGTTSEPHLHIHLQRQDPLKTLHPVFAEGLPLYFSDGRGGRIMPSTGAVLGHR